MQAKGQSMKLVQVDMEQTDSLAYSTRTHSAALENDNLQVFLSLQAADELPAKTNGMKVLPFFIPVLQNLNKSEENSWKFVENHLM